MHPCTSSASSTAKASCLRLVAAAAPATASPLELAALGAHVGLGIGVGHTGGPAEVLDSLALALGAAQQHAVLAGGGSKGQLVKGQALATSLQGGAAGG